MLDFKLGGMREKSIGHLLLNAILMRNSKDEYSGKIILAVNKHSICNYAAFEIAVEILREKYDIIISHNIFIRFIQTILAKAQKKWNLGTRFYFNLEWIHQSKKNISYGSIYDFNKYKTDVKTIILNEKFKHDFDKWRLANDVSGPFAIVFSRDGAYHPQTKNDIRNSSFEKLKPSIEFLNKSKFTVIRMGREHLATNDAADTKSYIDYSKTKCKSDYVELMLVKNAELFIGSNSGFVITQLLFETPLLIHNHVPPGLVPANKNCTYIMKHYMFNGERVPYANLPKEIWLSEDHSKLNEMGYELLENSADEILQAIKIFFSEGHKHSIKCNFEFQVSVGNSRLSKLWLDKVMSIPKNI